MGVCQRYLAVDNQTNTQRSQRCQCTDSEVEINYQKEQYRYHIGHQIWCWRARRNRIS